MRRIVESKIRASLRSYDVVVRCSDNEFVYSVACADINRATQRFETIRASLEPVTGAWLTAGFALLRDQDTLAEVIARAAADVAADRAPVWDETGPVNGGRSAAGRGANHNDRAGT